MTSLLEWWRQRGYEGNPLFVRAEEIPARIWQARFDRIAPLGQSTPVINGRKIGEPRMMSSRLIEQIIGRGTCMPVLICGQQGSGKTFFRILAAEYCRRDHCATIEITWLDLSNAGIMATSTSDLIAATIARCLYTKLRSRFATLSDDKPELSREKEDVYTILAKCGQLIDDKHEGPCDSMCYVFLDGLDRLFEIYPQREEAKTAVTDFVRAVVALTCGPSLALRLFLPQELEFLAAQNQQLESVRLVWSVEDIMEMIERWLELFRNAPGSGPYLPQLLDPQAQSELRRELSKRGRQVCPRDAINTLRAVAQYAAEKDIITSRITEKDFRAAQKFRRRLWRPPWHAIRLWIGRCWNSAPIFLTKTVLKAANILRTILGWLEKARDRVEAIVTLVFVVAGVIFVLWCLLRSYVTHEPWPGCIEYLWRVLRRYLIGE